MASLCSISKNESLLREPERLYFCLVRTDLSFGPNIKYRLISVVSDHSPKVSEFFGTVYIYIYTRGNFRFFNNFLMMFQILYVMVSLLDVTLDIFALLRFITFKMSVNWICHVTFKFTRYNFWHFLMIFVTFKMSLFKMSSDLLIIELIVFV